MNPDWSLWALHGAIVGVVYALLITRLNKHSRNGRARSRLVLLEAAVGMVLAGGLVCGMTGLWWLWRPIALAYLTLGAPLIFVVLITDAVTERYENAEVDKILRDTTGAVREPGLRGGLHGSDGREN